MSTVGCTSASVVSATGIARAMDGRSMAARVRNFIIAGFQNYCSELWCESVDVLIVEIIVIDADASAFFYIPPPKDRRAIYQRYTIVLHKM